MTTATKDAPLKTVEVLEDFYTPIGTDTIDEESAVIRGVKVLGKVSENRVIYTDSAMMEAARLYENAPVNIDHPSRDNPKVSRGVMEGVGFLKDVKFRTDGLYGDFHYYKTHPYAATVLERARRNPLGFGLSHNADVAYRITPQGRVVEQIRKVRSVDVVGKPATTKGLFESVDEEPTMKKYSLRQLVESYGSPDEKRHLTLLEDADVLDREVELEEESASVKAGFDKVLEEIRESGDAEASAELLQAESRLALGPVKIAGDDGTNVALESVQRERDLLKQELEQMRLEQKVTTLCESEGFKPNDVQRKALCVMESDDERISLIGTWKDSGKPRRSGRATHLEDVGSYEEELAKLQDAE